MQWNKVGYSGWYRGEIKAYNSESQKHVIEWLDDDSRDSIVDLLSCKMCVEWRLGQPDENLKKAIKMLNKEAITSGDDTSDNEGEGEDIPPQDQ